MEAAAQIGLLHYSGSKYGIDKDSHIAAAEEDIAVPVVDGKAAVGVLDGYFCCSWLFLLFLLLMAVVVVVDAAAVVEDN